MSKTLPAAEKNTPTASITFYLAKMHLHFLRARTIASYNDLTWHNFASFLFLLFLFYHSKNQRGIIAFSLLPRDNSAASLLQRFELHTLFFLRCAQFRTPRSWVDKQLHFFRSNWFFRQYRQRRFLAPTTFRLQKFFHQTVF